MKREAYRAVNVKQVFIEPLVADKAGLTADVGIDVSKSDLLAVLRWSDSRFERPWRVKNPEEIPDLIHRLQPLAEGRSLTIALESTGTYGDALRQALTDAKLSAHRVSGKAVHDYAEIFDGVPSQHDGKDAAIVAELAALGKSSPWPYQPPTEFDQELEYWVERADTQQRIEMIWLGQLEALLARHWPEATRYLELSSETLLQVLMAYGGSGRPGSRPRRGEAAAKLGRSVPGRGKDRTVCAGRGIQHWGAANGRRSAADRGVRRAAWTAKHEVQKAAATAEKLAQDHTILARLAAVVGWMTACVLWVFLGNPANYHCAEAYRKAMGLNLKERSSGRHEGQLKITKRGPGVVRRWLFFAAMRWVQRPGVVEWYEAKKARHPKGGTLALVAVMRKLALGLHAMVVGSDPFDAKRLFSPEIGKRARRGKKKAKKEQKKERQKV